MSCLDSAALITSPSSADTTINRNFRPRQNSLAGWVLPLERGTNGPGIQNSVPHYNRCSSFTRSWILSSRLKPSTSTPAKESCRESNDSLDTVGISEVQA